MGAGAQRLSGYPHALVAVACDRCGRRGRLSKARLLAEHGDVALPDLLNLIAADCPRAGTSVYDRCRVRYPALARPRARSA